jgi:hypothetical protein
MMNGIKIRRGGIHHPGKLFAVFLIIIFGVRADFLAEFYTALAAFAVFGAAVLFFSHCVTSSL